MEHHPFYQPITALIRAIFATQYLIEARSCYDYKISYERLVDQILLDSLVILSNTNERLQDH